MDIRHETLASPSSTYTRTESVTNESTFFVFLLSLIELVFLRKFVVLFPFPTLDPSTVLGSDRET